MEYKKLFVYEKECSNKPLQELLELIEKEAIEGEKKDTLFYGYLINAAPNNEQKDIIIQIQTDEKRHKDMFMQIYKDLTNTQIEMSDNEENIVLPDCYLDGIKQALENELGVVKTYRKIYEGLCDKTHRDMLFEIITDELIHGSKYNYIIFENISMIKPYRAKCYTPDEWIEFILNPLVKRALDEVRGGMRTEYILQKYMLASVLIGQCLEPKDAILMVEDWDKNGECSVLKKSKSRR